MMIHEQPLKTAGTSIYPYSPVIEEIFRFKPRFGEEMSMAIRVGNTLHVPREACPVGVEDHRVYLNPVAINCKFPPRNDDQKQCIKKSVDLLKSGQNHIMDAPTGFGKSYCGAAIACEMGQPTLIIVTKQDLMDSWYDCLVNLIGISPSQIGIIQQDKCIYKGKRFVLAMIHSLVIENKYEAAMRNYFGMVIFDECHHLAADGFTKACMMFPAVFRLGLSATAGRSDGKWCLIEAHIGPVLVKGTTIPMRPKILVVQTGWTIPLEPQWVDDPEMGGKTLKMKPLRHSPGRMINVIKAMAEDYDRNTHIVDYAAACHRKGRSCVIMSELVDDHLKPLFQRLSKYIPGQDMDYYIGGRSKAQLTIAKTKPIVLATYQMCGEGTDVPAWDSMVFATPRANIKQSIGRIMRTKEGKLEPVALDLVDNSPVLKNFYLARERQYFQVKATIVKM